MQICKVSESGEALGSCAALTLLVLFRHLDRRSRDTGTVHWCDLLLIGGRRGDCWRDDSLIEKIEHRIKMLDPGILKRGELFEKQDVFFQGGQSCSERGFSFC